MTLAIYGAGSLGREILSLILNQDKAGEVENLVFIDDVCEDKEIVGIPKYKYDEFNDVRHQYNDLRIIIASGEPQYRRKLFEKTKKDGYQLGTVVYPNSFIGVRTEIGEGTIIFPNAYISNDICIGNNCIVHANAKIESCCIVDDNTFVSSGAFIGANTQIGDGVFVGPNASLYDHIKIGANSFIGMGSVVIRDVEEGIVVAGNPATKIRDNLSGRVFRANNCSVGQSM